MEAATEYRKAWHRFRRNKPALFGLGFVLTAVLVALFGYVLAPDNSPNANAQIPEIALQAPGFQATLLRLKTNAETNPSAWYSILWSGQAMTYKPIAIHSSSFFIEGDSAQYQAFGTKSGLHKISLEQLDSPQPELQMYPLGTDKYGRCILSRLILGFKVSLMVGLIAVLISLSLGLMIGAIGGYFGGRTDDLVMLLINTVWSIPTLLLVFAVVLALGRGIGIIFLAVGLTMWVDVARVVRGQVLSIKQLAFVEAAQSMGLGHRRILFRHILPNLLGPVMVVTAGNFATAILVESGLSYLGFGVQPPASSWGSMLNENYGYALGGKPLLALAPALAIALTVLAFNLVGNGLRDALDVRS